MKIKTNILSLILVILILMSFVSCGAGKTPSDFDDTSSNNSEIENLENMLNDEQNQDSLESVHEGPEFGESFETTNNSYTDNSTNFDKNSQHVHKFSPATCITPEKCQCGKTRGKALGHKFLVATCTKAKTCEICKIAEGEPLKHEFYAGKCKYCETADPSMKRVYSESQKYSFSLPNSWSTKEYTTETTIYYGLDNEYEGEHTAIISNLFGYYSINCPVFTFVIYPHNDEKFSGYYEPDTYLTLISSDDNFDVYLESFTESKVEEIFEYFGEQESYTSKVDELKSILARKDEIAASFRWE